MARCLIIVHMDSDYAIFIGWLRTALATISMILLLIALFHHTSLGLQVVIEDYVHSGAKFAVVIAVRLGCFALASAGIHLAHRLQQLRGTVHRTKACNNAGAAAAATAASNGCLDSPAG
jgi:succinate dehydrogenase hydrophobic membrane anchor protein